MTTFEWESSNVERPRNGAECTHDIDRTFVKFSVCLMILLPMYCLMLLLLLLLLVCLCVHLLLVCPLINFFLTFSLSVSLYRSLARSEDRTEKSVCGVCACHMQRLFVLLGRLMLILVFRLFEQHLMMTRNVRNEHLKRKN